MLNMGIWILFKNHNINFKIFIMNKNLFFQVNQISEAFTKSKPYVHLLRSLFRGEGGPRFCSRSNKEKNSLKICNGRGGGLEIRFLRNVISERLPSFVLKI